MSSLASALKLENVVYDKKGSDCVCDSESAEGAERAEQGDDQRTAVRVRGRA